MGNTSSFPEAHIRIYKNLLGIQNARVRGEMIQTLLQGPEYVQTFRQAGIYAQMLNYVAKVNQGLNPGPLPGEQTQQQQILQQQQMPQQHRPPQITTLATRGDSTAIVNPYHRLTKNNSNEKALAYFQMCLQVLNLEEEVALTDEELKKAYKKAAMKAHPDKGGSEQHFEAVTRAYAYLTEILKRIQGGRTSLKKVDAPNLLKTERTSEADAWKQAEPVRLNPDKLDMDAFNKMFEATRIPDPDGDGYGDWLKTEGQGAQTPNFSGKFNRDVFNSMFEQEAAKTREARQQNALTIAAPQALLFNPSYGVELGRERGDFTTAANADMGLHYTDLKAAYTTESTFSGQVADVRVENRSFDQYQQSRKKAPDPLRNEELAAIQQMEKEANDREKRRQLRAAEESLQADDFHERMKRLVITDGVPIERQKRR
jgi:curved DNA-binding protein CbpA